MASCWRSVCRDVNVSLRSVGRRDPGNARSAVAPEILVVPAIRVGVWIGLWPVRIGRGERIAVRPPMPQTDNRQRGHSSPGPSRRAVSRQIPLGPRTAKSVLSANRCRCAVPIDPPPYGRTHEDARPDRTGALGGDRLACRMFHGMPRESVVRAAGTDAETAGGGGRPRPVSPARHRPERSWRPPPRLSAATPGTGP